jgi:ribosomal protein L32E
MEGEVMDVEQIKSRAEVVRIIHEVAVKIREQINDVVEQVGSNTHDGDDVELLIKELVFD